MFSSKDCSLCMGQAAILPDEFACTLVHIYDYLVHDELIYEADHPRRVINEANGVSSQ